MAEKIDPYQKKRTYENWKSKLVDAKGNITGQIEGINKRNSDLILKYILDMEEGLNVAVVKGSRSHARLITLKDRMSMITKLLDREYKITDISKTTEEQITKLFNAMRSGNILNNRKKVYMSTADYIKVFSAFWHWHIKVNRKQGINVKDIVIDLDATRAKPKWVYLSEDQFKQLCDHSKYDYKVLQTFLWFTGVRSPTELINLRVSDLIETKEGHYILNIRDEVSKTFGRKIKLIMCSKILKEYIQRKGLSGDDQLFKICPRVANQYLKRLAKKVLGESISEAGEKYSNLTMYDYRHNSCCYWLPRYKSESALKYRFGWKSSDKIHYYSELLGMKDTIQQEDILIDVTATEIEKQLQKSQQERGLMQDNLSDMGKNFMTIMQTVADLKKTIDRLQEEKRTSELIGAEVNS